MKKQSTFKVYIRGGSKEDVASRVLENKKRGFRVLKEGYVDDCLIDDHKRPERAIGTYTRPFRGVYARDPKYVVVMERENDRV